MNERQAKLQALKNKQVKQAKQSEIDSANHKELLASITALQSNISALEASLSANGTLYTKSQKDLAQNFTTLREILEAGLNVTNIKDIEQAKEIIVSNLKDLPKPVVNTTKTEIPKWLASEKSVDRLNDNVIKVVEALIDLEANIKPKQTADEFVPMRRVVRRGNKLEFDDSYWGGTSAGGGGSSSAGVGLTDAELRATPVPVSMSSDIEIGAVELKNGTDDTRATVTAGNALKVDGSGVTQPVSGTVTANLGTLNGAATAANQQTDALTDTELRATPVPVSGTVTATPTGTQNVDVTANTIGLATAANQLPDGHNVTVDNGIGAAAVPIQDGGNSITVDGTVAATQSGTWTEANSAAIKTAVETIDNAISGSEMQVDVVGALPAGTNAIGKLAANSGVDIGDVDVTSSVSSTLDHGSNLDIDTTAEQITSTSFACKFGVTVKSAVDNTATVYIGNSDVTDGDTAATDGFPLEPGESITLPVTNSNLLYAIAASANQKVFWIGV